MTRFDDVLRECADRNTTPLIINHLPFTEQRIVHGEMPYDDAPTAASYYGQAQGMFGSDGTFVDLGEIYHRACSTDSALTAQMGARSRTGYALKTMLAHDETATVAQRLLRAVEHTSKAPMVLRIPSPVVWLASAAATAGDSDTDGITDDHAESAAMYVSDWLRRFVELPVAAVLLDGSRDVDLPDENLSSYQPVVNAAHAVGWGVLLQVDGRIDVAGAEAVGAVVPESFWDGGGSVPDGDFRLTTVPATADPDRITERLEGLR